MSHTDRLENTMDADRTYADLFPSGRVIYYEGDDPERFAQEIVARFGFDPRTANIRPYDYPYGWSEEYGFSFMCPPEHLDAICDNYPMGS